MSFFKNLFRSKAQTTATSGMALKADGAPVSGWEVLKGMAIVNEAVQKRILDRDESAQACIVVISHVSVPSMGYEIRGRVSCHGCKTEIPFAILGNMGAGGGTEYCPSCQNQVSIGATSDTDKRREFVWASPATSQIGQARYPVNLFIDAIENA